MEHKKRMGTLLATGLIVGEALFGVVFAGIVAATSDDSVLQVVGDGFDKWAQALGVIVFAASVADAQPHPTRLMHRGHGQTYVTALGAGTPR